MRAQVGDWLIVKSRTDTGHARRAEIIEVRSPDGQPPYAVRWVDSGRESLVFPGPDAHVLSSSELAQADQVELDRITRVQDAIRGRRPSGD